MSKMADKRTRKIRDAYIRKHYMQKPTADIAKVLGVTAKYVNNRAMVIGLARPQERVNRDERAKKLDHHGLGKNPMPAQLFDKLVKFQRGWL